MLKNNKTKGCFLALGTFDGLHLGHKKVITAGEYEKRYVLMFREHPLKSLTGEAPSYLLTKRKEKEILSKWNAEPIYLDFDDIKELTPDDFFKNTIVEKIGAKILSVGFNFHFGKNASGDVKTLRSLCEKNGVELIVSDAVMFENYPVSSTRIREAVKLGDIETANKMLGRKFSYDFEVVHGDERGRTINAPTINQFFEKGFTVPKYGVYSALVVADNKTYPAVTNIGIRPTIGNSEERSETHILGFSGDLYGKNIEVMPIRRLREEKKFSSLSELKMQIENDKKTAENIAKEYMNE